MSMHGTTVIGVLRNGEVSLGADGQVTLGNTVVKGNAKKVRTLYSGKVLCGFAGSTADAFTLVEKFEKFLEANSGQLLRSSVELAKTWRTDKHLRSLEAMMIVANNQEIYILSGNGDVIEPEEGIAAIGSGGAYALSAARTLLKHTDKDSNYIVNESLKIAADICIYTNSNITTYSL